MKKQILLVTLLAVCAVLFAACAKKNMNLETMESESKMDDAKTTESTSMSNEQMMANDPAPNFTFTNFDGNTVSLADFSGKPVYIKFWASWCSVCLSSLPEVDELSSMDKDFEVITVVAPGFSGEKNMEDFKTWYADKGYENITVLFDEDGTYMKEFGIRAFPSSAYIDENGGLIKLEIGHTSNETIIDSF
ncbi:MAG: redoxin family protein [Lachnospiraceae bacterium]